MKFARRLLLVPMSLIVASLLACAAVDNGTATIPSGGNDCFWANSIHDWKALDDRQLIVWSPNRNCPYQVDLATRCIGLRFSEQIGFQDRDGRICSFGGDAIVVPGPTSERCSIAAITRLSPEQAEVLLLGNHSEVDSPAAAGTCGPDSPVEIEAAAVIGSEDIGDPEQWGAASNIVSVKHLLISAQPDQETLEIARDRGVGVVIDLREPAEISWNEQEAATDLDLIYYNKSVSRTGSSFDETTFQEISELAARHSDSRILLHCSSGNRAAAWFAAHLALDHGMEIEPSIKLSKTVGLTSQSIEKRVRYFLGHETSNEK